ncbi:AAA family ATPase [Blastopirellula marina]|uniref:ATPase AAA-type core domain-containing protein n=1 Tax=Blastopirellula marina TaxID=124 RepID=A0A2S8GRS2_9BACT|nr:ATP-binding protein [Blastopirellula marina]PQO46724.1 hypothetical protein C5Y93_07775 [Blastopirellula marina]
MLVSFSVSNFRSFGEEQTLSMVASNRLTDHPSHCVRLGNLEKYVVRCALLYGANAAGKSNLVKAMAFAQRVILSSRVPGTAEFFRFKADLSVAPSSFEFRFLVDDTIYVYGFDISRNRILREWLAYLDEKESPAVIFSRDEAKQDSLEVIEEEAGAFSEDSELFYNLRLLKQTPLRHTDLLLSKIAAFPDDRQGATLRSVIRWLTTDLEVLEIDHRSCDLLERLYKDATFREFSGKFLNRVDTGISSLSFDDVTREYNDFERMCLDRGVPFEEMAESFYGCRGDFFCEVDPDDSTKMIEHRLFSCHLPGGQEIPFTEESDGTQQLLHLLPLISAPREDSKVVVIDELDRSLHPLLCWELIDFFSRSCPGARKQLIVTTHESHLLSQELLRRDEYWFVEKDPQTQQSYLTSLSDFNIRNDLQIRKGYLAGRFGGIPVMGSAEEIKSLLDCPVEEPDGAAPKS